MGSVHACRIDGCDGEAKWRGMCRRHYKRAQYHGHVKPRTTEERLLEKTEKDGDCWVWTGSRHSNGYGRMSVKGRSRMTHRLSYELAFGPIPDGMNVCHRCDRKACVNPAHLFLGTQADNMRDMDAKGRRVTPDRRGESNGRAALSEEQVREIRRLRREADLLDWQIGIVLRVKPGQVRDVLRSTWRHVM